MKILRGAAPICAALILLQAAPLVAQPAGSKVVPGETAEMTDKARELYNAGSDALQKGRWGEAHANLLAAWSLKKHHQIAGNLAAVEVQLGRYREAAEHLAYYLREAPATKQKERQSAQALLIDARKHLGALTIKVEPTGAEVLVDGAVVGKAPLSGEVFVEPGKWTIEARLDGYTTARTTVEMAAGSSREVPLTLVGVEAKSDADVPRAVGASGVAVKSGSPSARKGEGKETGEKGPNKGVIIAGIGASVVAVGMGVGFAIGSNVNAGEADEKLAALLRQGGPKPCSIPELLGTCREIDDRNRASDTFTDVSIWSFVAGGLLGVGTAIYVLVPRRSEPTSAVRALPVVVDGGGGVVVVGGW
jgi:hypothetical protein